VIKCNAMIWISAVAVAVFVFVSGVVLGALHNTLRDALQELIRKHLPFLSPKKGPAEVVVVAQPPDMPKIIVRDHSRCEPGRVKGVAKIRFHVLPESVAAKIICGVFEVHCQEHGKLDGQGGKMQPEVGSGEPITYTADAWGVIPAVEYTPNCKDSTCPSPCYAEVWLQYSDTQDVKVVEQDKRGRIRDVKD